MKRSLGILLSTAALPSRVAQTPPSTAPTANNSTASTGEGNGRLSGQAFFDSNNNGIRDSTLDYPQSSIPVSLHLCNVSDANDVLAAATNDTLGEAVTDDAGEYSFGSLAAGSYRISVADLPSWYTVSSAWSGAANESGALLFPDAQSVVDPETRSSLCWEVADDVERGNVDIGIRLNVPPVANPISGPVASSPSVGPTTEGSSSDVPSVAPSTNANASTTAPSDNSTSFSTPGEIVVASPPPTFSSPTNAPTTMALPTNSPTVPPTSNATIVEGGTPTLSPTNSSNATVGDNHTTIHMNSTAPSEAPSVLLSSAPSEPPSNETRSVIPTPSPISSETAEPVPSTAPSNETASMIPTPSPMWNETAEPTAIIITSSPTFSTTTAEPTKPPRMGDLIGPVTTDGLQITLTGISALENDTAWGEYTASHIENFFSIGFDVWDVAVDITVRGQLPGGRRVSAQRRRREQSEPSVRVIYDQTTTYKTDAGRDTNYVITEPFASSLDQARYILYLADRSIFYTDVTAVSSVTLPGEEVSDNDAEKVVAPAPAPAGMSNKTMSIVIGVCAAVGAVLLLGGLYLVYKSRDRGAKDQEAEPVNHGSTVYAGSPGGMREDPEMGSGMEGQHQGSTLSLAMNQGSPPQNRNDDDNISSTASESFQPPPGNTFEVVAPAGKLGVVVDIPPDRTGPPFVCDIKETSPLYGELQIGDKIFAVDNEDVRKMSAIKVSKLLAQKSENPERVITVFREHDG